ncbi:amino acid adenylation domain-containing protein [Actinomadura darangshiensis]|uniref:Amino acid adenylation domain-containing protein n=1 Tax=Actinomadura darangshiensis TaxID=705336 RepID=A0A4R5BH55_9ACTN|nr:non-ribosomal peptide synthetase [Actinomadura darangshiensis]TDD83154.1 amino acid adenylation domain-containing protein [Actinomadura darangshiensis]
MADRIQDVYPLAPLQQGMLFHSIEAPAEAAGAYWAQEVGEYTIDPMDADAMRRSWELVMERHPVLRTGFVWEGVPEPLQVVHSEAALPFEELDWSGADDAEQQVRLEKLLAADRDAGFDLASPPLMRVRLIGRGGHRYWMVWTFHHICLDGWSIPIVVDEVQAAYDQLTSGTSSPALPPVRPYRDFIQWLAGRDAAEAGAFWRDHLAAFEAPTPLPVDRPATGHWSHDTHVLDLPAGVTRGLIDLSRRARVTLSTVVQAAWALLLSRYSRHGDVTFGLTVSGRPAQLSGMESMVGLFINTLPMHTTVRPDEPFIDWLRRLQDAQLAMQRFDYTPLAEIQKATRIPPGVSLFDSIIAFQNLPEGDLDEDEADPGDGAAVVDAFATVEQSRYPLMFSVDLEGALSLGVQFSTAAFDRATVERLLDQLRQALAAVAQTPGLLVRDVPLCSPEERRQIVEDWSAQPPQPFTRRTLTELFRDRVAAAPDARAVLCAGEELTYAELDRRANRVARWLRRNGVRPQDRVGLCFDRSVEFVIALLGVVEAGAAYVPLVPGLPDDRLRHMIGTAEVGVVVTGADRPAGLGSAGVRVLELAEADDGAATEPVEGTGTRPGSTAYVMFTSGSTGEPKGVEVTHEGVARAYQDPVARVVPDDVMSHLVPVSFDASTFEIWGALLNGATLAIATPRELEEIDIVSIMRRNEVTVAVVPTGLFHQAAELAPEAFAGLRMLLVGGDAMSTGHARKIKEQLPDLTVINAYGPTETTIACTVYDIDDGLPPGEGSVPIGRPLAGTGAYVLDDRLNVAPVGQPGELFIGGGALARGYAGRPDLTAERFVPDPVAGVPGRRLYRSGDLARWRADGVLEFLGRVDDQVKIRGFRIELAEVRAALAAHPGLRDAVVTVHEDEATGKRLVGYVVPEPGQAAPGPADLRAHMHRRLPEYMVPALFVAVDAIPLTEHGKVDRRALPAPEVTADEDAEYAPPTTEAEETLAEIWAQVLQAEQVGIHDNFFALGGDSMLSLQIVARARKAGLEVSVAEVFEAQTVAELARVARPATDGIRAEQGAVSGPVPLLPVQRWFAEHEIGARDHWNWSGVFALRPGTDTGMLEQVVHALVDHHDALRMRLAFDSARHDWAQYNAPSEDAEVFSVVDHRHVPDDHRDALVTEAMAAAQTSLDLADGPLLRVLCFDRGDDPAWLGITVHHLVVDLLSWNVLLEDLHLGYEALAATGSLDGAFGPKTTSFKEWAEELDAYAASGAARAELPYWTRQLEPGFEVPLDTRGPNTEASRATVTALLDADATAALLGRAHRAYGTRINDLLLAALLPALGGWAGVDRLTIGLENHGRHPVTDAAGRMDLSRTVGWFTSIHPVALSAADPSDPGTLVTAVRDELRSVPNGGVGFGALRRLAPEDDAVRELRAWPDPQVVFNYSGGFDAVEDDEVGLFAEELPDELNGTVMTEDQRRPYVLQIEAARTGDGRLEFEWGYSTALHRPETIARVAQAHVAALRELIEHCDRPST